MRPIGCRRSCVIMDDAADASKSVDGASGSESQSATNGSPPHILWWRTKRIMRAHAVCPRASASISAVSPNSLTASILEPGRSRHIVASRCPFMTAPINGVLPPCDLWLTSAPAERRMRMMLACPKIAAPRNGVWLSSGGFGKAPAASSRFTSAMWPCFAAMMSGDQPSGDRRFTSLVGSKASTAASSPASVAERRGYGAGGAGAMGGKRIAPELILKIGGEARDRRRPRRSGGRSIGRSAVLVAKTIHCGLTYATIGRSVASSHNGRLALAAPRARAAASFVGGRHASAQFRRAVASCSCCRVSCGWAVSVYDGPAAGHF